MKLRNPFTPVLEADLFLLDRVAQPVVDYLGRRWGVDFVRLGMGFVWSGNIYNIISGYFVIHENIWLMVWMVWLSVLLAFGTIAVIHFFFAPNCRQRPNVNRLQLIGMRMLYSLFLVIDLLPPSSSAVFFALLLGAGVYVLSCQTPPPKEKREPFWSRWLQPEAT